MKKIETPYDALTYKIIGLAMAIHNELGPGFPEEIYHRAMIVGLTVDEVPHVTEFEIEISFRGQTIGKFELDLVADQKVIVELKAVSALAPIHEQQVIAYLAASGLPVGLLINFGAAKLEFKRLFPPKAVQSSIAYQARRSKSQSA
ncbi:MAG: GxxExxY protein [Anaerolineales bacterium]|nr:GxxExxY protein [Anaerolineales bacterium]